MTSKKKTVYAPMSADVVHSGHLNILSHGAQYGEVVVGLLSDAAIAAKKRVPYMNYQERFQVVSNLKDVTSVVCQETPDYTPNLKRIKPDFVIHGDDWSPKARQTVIDVIDEWGGTLIELPYTKTISSTRIQNTIKKEGITTDQRLSSLKDILSIKSPLRVLEAHDGLSALIADRSSITGEGRTISFDAIWLSSLTDSLSKGKPDNETVDKSSRLSTLHEIMDASRKPVIMDGDTGGTVQQFRSLVKSLERIGVSAVVIEDKKGQKLNSYFGIPKNHSQESAEVFAEKIRAGVRSKINDKFMIIARIESLVLGDTVENALERSKLYSKAGADAIMIHSSMSNAHDVKEFSHHYKKLQNTPPLMVVPTAYPSVTVNELSMWGVDIIVYANHLLRASYPAMKHVAESILTHGRSLEIEKTITPINELLELFPHEE